MLHLYTAKLYLDDGEILVNTGNDVEQLLVWLREQAESSFDEIRGEIIDNKTQHIVKNFEYVPPPE